MSFALPDKMIAIEIKEAGGPEVLMPTKRDIPVINKDEVLLKVLAAGVVPAPLVMSGSDPNGWRKPAGRRNRNWICLNLKVEPMKEAD